MTTDWTPDQPLRRDSMDHELASLFKLYAATMAESKAKIAALEADKARLDWLQSCGDFLSVKGYPRKWDANTGGDIMNWTPDMDEAGFATVREAIDAARTPSPETTNDR